MKTSFRIIYLYCLLFQLCLYQSGYAQNNDLRFQHLTTADGLSDNNVWSICQDREGFMWFGTLDGLNKYDGYTFTVLKPDPRDLKHSLHHNIISDIHEDRKGRLWVVTFGGGFHQVNKYTGQVTRFEIRPTSTTLWNVFATIYEDQKGMLWIAGHGGVARFDPDTQKYTLFEMEKSPFFTSIVEDATGQLWVGSMQGMYQLDPHSSKFTPVLLDASLAVQPGCTSLLLDKEGTLWAGTNGEGIFRLYTRSKAYHFIRYNPGGLVNKNVRFNGLYEDSKGYVWLITVKGLQRIDRRNDQVINLDSNPNLPGSLSHQHVSSIFEDPTGIIWIGTNNGVNKASPHAKKFKTYQIIPTLPSVILNQNTITDILEDESGAVWLGSAVEDSNRGFRNGLFRFDLNNKQINSFPAVPADPKGLSSNNVMSVYEDKKKRLWVGTQEALHLLNKASGNFTRYSSDLPVSSIVEDPYGKLWFGASSSVNGGIASFDPADKAFTYYKYNPEDISGLKDGRVFGMLASRSGDIWVALSGGGIARLNQLSGKFTNYSSNPTGANGSLNDKDVRSLHEDAAGIIWAGTNQGGLHRFDPTTNTFTYFTMNDGLPSNHIVSITSDSQGNLWMGTNQGLSRFDPKAKIFRNYSVSDGLPANEFTVGSVHRKEGKLLFGTVNGFVVFHPDSIGSNTIVPPVYITGLKILEQSRKLPANKIELVHQENFLSFDFVGLNYDAPEKNQYAYQLVGVDKDWVLSGNRRFASYTKLDPGTYTFRVKASNNDGVWNEKGALLNIIIHPPWWRTWWAYGFYFLCFLAGAFAVDRYQRKRLIEKEREKARERELAQARELEKAYKQLGQQKEELQATLVDLQATQNQLIQKEKMASLGELTAGIAHEIQNPLNFVNNFSGVSVELIEELQQELAAGEVAEAKAISEDIKQNLEKITHHGQRADSIVKGMLQHSRASSSEKQLTNLNALTEEYLSLSYHGLRTKNKDFNANLVTDFDSNIGKIEVVPQELGRVLLNLFNNAFYATQQKKAQQNGHYQPEVKVSTCQQNGQIEIRIRDNGTGIPESAQNKIFQPFFTTKPTGQGTGLGLSLSYDIITKGHGGELKVESEDGAFTTFSILLPLK